MPGHPWLSELRGSLARRGLPRAYIARFLAELEDHLQDISLEQEVIMNTDVTKATDVDAPVERLGSREQLVEQAVANFQGASFAGRHPVLVFVLAPIPVAIVCWIVFLFVAAFGLEGLGYVLGPGIQHRPASEWPDALVRSVRALPLLSSFIPPAAVVLLWCRLARRSGRSWRWCLTSCLLIALAAGLHVMTVTTPTATSKGAMYFGFGVVGTWKQAVQFGVPLLIGSLSLLWGVHSSNPRWAAASR
jgi:hypothetical protein